MKPPHIDNDQPDTLISGQDDSFRPSPSVPAAIVSWKNSPWRDRLSRSGFFFAALLFHLVLFLLVANWIVFRQPETTETETSTFQQIKIPPQSLPPTPPPPPAAGEARNLLDPDIHVTPTAVPVQVIVPPATPTFTMESKPLHLPNLPAPPSVPQGAGLQGSTSVASSAGLGSAFGVQGKAGDAQFIGYLYDLKQSPSRHGTGMTTGLFHRKMVEFINSDWNPRLLAPYYKTEIPLVTPSIYIPTLKAADGPKAFGVENEVKPNMFLILYHVRASPAQLGHYRLAGIGDDVFAVRVNGQVVLDGSLSKIWTGRSKQTSYPIENFRPSSQNEAQLQVSEPFLAVPGQPVDIEVLLGEEPGGNSNYFLLIQRDETLYETQRNGAPLLPIFQVTANSVGPVGPSQTFPPYSTRPEPWVAVGK